MKLRRTRAGWFGAILFLPVGVYSLLAWFSAENPRFTTFVLGVAGTIAGLYYLWWMTRPFRFVIEPQGLDLRSTHGVAKIPWAALDAIVLEQARPTAQDKHPEARILLVPAAGVTLTAGKRTWTHDGHECLKVLSFSDVRDTPDEVAEVLAAHAGPRFVDGRAGGPSPFEVPDFTVVLRGYSEKAVSDLVTRVNEARASASLAEQLAVASELETRQFPVELRGYDRRQVDAYFTRAAAELRDLTQQ